MPNSRRPVSVWRSTWSSWFILRPAVPARRAQRRAPLSDRDLRRAAAEEVEQAAELALGHTPRQQPEVGSPADDRGDLSGTIPGEKGP
jgi:hypothetical protein